MRRFVLRVELLQIKTSEILKTQFVATGYKKLKKKKNNKIVSRS